MNTPEISIIIPTYNRADLIGQAIESVLAQTYANWELIVINDASTDTTEKVVKGYTTNDARIRYIKNEKNLGISVTRNRGLHEARGTYIAMLDSDDIWIDPEKLTRQIAAFKNAGVDSTNSNSTKPLGIVGTWITFIDNSGAQTKNVSFAATDAAIRASLLYKNHIMQSSVMFLKQAAIDAGGYDASLATMEDHDLWLKIGMKYAIETLPIYAVGYRLHSGSVSKQKRRQVARDEITVIRRWKNSYPGFAIGMIKGYARLLLSIV